MRTSLCALLLLGFTGTMTVQAQRVIELPPRDHVIAADIQRLWRIGRPDGAEWETFVDIAAVAFDARGRILVVDRGANRVLQFDSTGGFLRYIGRPGGGPGEYGGVAGVAVTIDGFTAVADALGRAILLYDAEGVYVRSAHMGDARALYPGMRPAPEGGVLIPQVSTMTIEPGRYVVYHHSLAPGASPVIRYRIAAAGDTAGPQTTRSGNSLQRTLPPVFAPALRFAPWGRDHIAMAGDVNYAISTSGQRVDAPTTIRRNITPRRVTEADREAVRERRRTRAGSSARQLPGGFTAGGATGAALEAELRALRFAERMPVIAGLGVDSDGRLWIARTGPAVFRAGPIDVVSPQGDYAGTIGANHMPAAFGPRGRIARIETDADGVQSIVVEQVRFR